MADRSDPLGGDPAIPGRDALRRLFFNFTDWMVSETTEALVEQEGYREGWCPKCMAPARWPEDAAEPVCLGSPGRLPCTADQIITALIADLVEVKDAGHYYRPSANGDRVEIEAVTASTVTPANVRWLWKDRIPLGMQSALIGMPGFGKTTLAVKITAGVTTGELEGDLLGHPSDVLFVSYEDVIDVRLRPMAEASGADLDRLHFLKAKRTGYVIDLTSQLPRIKELVREYTARFLVIDPLVAGLPSGKVNSFRDQDVRSVLAPIASLAEEQVLAVLTLGHFNKGAMSALLGTGGSIGFVGAPRSILAFGPDPRKEADQHVDRVLAHAKSNVGRMQPSLMVRVTSHVLDPFGAAIETSQAEIGGSCDVGADDLVQVPSDREGPKGKATKFLRELLADGPHKAKEAITLATDAGISERTLKRAKDDAMVVSYQETGCWWWRLPTDEELSASDDEEVSDDDE